MKREKSCGAVVIDDRGRVLVIKQTAGHTAFPKGHVEPGETEAETARREILEETGIEVEIDERFRTTDAFSPKAGVMKDVVYFLARPTGGELRPQKGEVESLAWLTPEEARAAVTYPASRRILDEAMAFFDAKCAR